MSESELVCITNRLLCRGDFLSRIEAIAAAHPDRIILREKDLSGTEYAMLAEKVTEICRRHHVRCSLHSFPGAAMRLGEKNIHLPLRVLRTLDYQTKQRFKEIGTSCHSISEIQEADALGASYVIAGHIFDTDCKRGLPGRGLRFLRSSVEHSPLPVYAIGGISEKNLSSVLHTGAKGACIMSGLMACDDPAAYLGTLRKAAAMRLSPSELLLYAITDRRCIGERSLYAAIEAACKGGAGIIQLREKGADDETLITATKQAAAICHRYGVRLIVNDNYRAALAAGADGVHVGAEDAPVAEIRALAGDDFIIGATAKTVEQAQRAEVAGADYLGVGAVFPSPTKPDAIRVTPAQFREIAGSVTIPAVAIGGISRENITELEGIGACGAAVVSAVFGAADIEAATAELKQLAGRIVR